ERVCQPVARRNNSERSCQVAQKDRQICALRAARPRCKPNEDLTSFGTGRELLKVNRLLKKAHLLRCARSPRSNVSINTPPLVDFSRASHLDLFEQPVIRVFQHPVEISPTMT